MFSYYANSGSVSSGSYLTFNIPMVNNDGNFDGTKFKCPFQNCSCRADLTACIACKLVKKSRSMLRPPQRTQKCSNEYRTDLARNSLGQAPSILSLQSLVRQLTFLWRRVSRSHQYAHAVCNLPAARLLCL